jgi:hypothetical protein
MAFQPLRIAASAEIFQADARWPCIGAHTHKRLRVEQLAHSFTHSAGHSTLPRATVHGRWSPSAVPPVVCNLSNPVFNISMHQQFARHEAAVKNALAAAA